MPRVNKTPLVPEQQALAAGSFPFVLTLVRELRQKGKHLCLDFDHAVSAGLYGLVLAARSYDPAKGQWPTHASQWVKSEIKDEANRWRRRGLTCRTGGHGGPAPEPPNVLGLDTFTEV